MEPLALINKLKEATPTRIFKKEEGDVVTYTGGLDKYTVTVMMKSIIDNSRIPPLDSYELLLFKIYDESNQDITPESIPDLLKLDIGYKLMNGKLFGGEK